MTALFSALREKITTIDADDADRWSLLYRDIESTHKQQELTELINVATRRHEQLFSLFTSNPTSPIYRYGVYGNLTELARLSVIKKYESAEQAYAQLSQVLDFMEPLREQADDNLYHLWREFTVIITRAIKQQSLTLPHIGYVQLDDIKPALLLAYDWYEDATLEEDLVLRNSISHPAFVSGTLEVLKGAT